MSSIIKRITERIRRADFLGFSFESPSSNLIIFLIIAISLFLLAGGVYNIVLQPPVLVPSPDYPIFYTLGFNDQSWSESLIALLLFSLGVTGGYLAYRSTRYGYKPREATLYLTIGIILLIVAFVGCEYIFLLKRGV